MTNALTLQDMVNAVISQATSEGKAKIAQEVSDRVCDKCGKPAMAGSKICKDCAEKDVKKERTDREGGDEGTEKTSSARIEKLANAVQYLVQNFDDIVGTEKVGAVASQATENVGAGKGPNVIPTNVDSPVGGEQGTVKGEAKVDTIAADPPTESGATPKAPSNAMKTNIDTMKPDYPESGVIKQARARLRVLKMNKLAESVDDGAARINTPKTQTLTLPEDQPSQMTRPAQVTSQEKMIGSADAAINYQKTQAKNAPKKSIGDVLNEKPQDVKQVLKPVLGDVVKEAQQQQAATGRALLQKIAQEGCKCETPESGDCRFCKVASRLKKAQGMRKKSEVESTSMGMGGSSIGPGGVPSTVQSSSPIGGTGSGTPPMM